MTCSMISLCVMKWQEKARNIITLSNIDRVESKCVIKCSSIIKRGSDRLIAV